MASSVGVRVVQQGAAGLARRLAMGEPLGAIWGGERVRVGWALFREGEVVWVEPPRPPPLPRGVWAPRPLRSLSDCDSKVTLRFMLGFSLVGKTGECQSVTPLSAEVLLHSCAVRFVYTAMEV